MPFSFCPTRDWSDLRELLQEESYIPFASDEGAYVTWEDLLDFSEACEEAHSA